MAINKKLIHFKTKAAFETELAANNILDTSIVFIKDTQEIYTHGQYYDGKALPDWLSDLKDLLPKDYKAGDVALYSKDKDLIILVAKEDLTIDAYPIDKYTPIGVVVIPWSHDIYGTGEVGIMSLKEMNYNTPDSGSTSYQGIYWGNSGVDTNLTNYDNVAYVGSNGTLNDSIQGVNYNAYLPSDNFIGKSGPEYGDTQYYYNNNNKYAPSPYMSDNDASCNPLYYDTSKGVNALSDFNGFDNTKILLKTATAQNDWKTATTITNKSDAGYAPAACCCWRYHTDGTNKGDWYLPAAGELGYIMPKLKAINETISKLNNLYNSAVGVQLNTNYNYRSSSEYSAFIAISILTNDGHVSDYGKIYDGNVRAFLRVIPQQSTLSKVAFTGDYNDLFGTPDFDSIQNETISLKSWAEKQGYCSYVDLGLPSGTLWATKNIGAEDEYDPGFYFAWGDTQGYTGEQIDNGLKDFTWNTYKFGTEENLTKYNSTDGKTVLEDVDDAAFVATNGKLKMPTVDLCNELISNTNCEELYLDNGGGYLKFTSKKHPDKFIIFKNSGYYYNNFYNTFGNLVSCWSNSLNTSEIKDGEYLELDNSSEVYHIARYAGLPVRGVVNPDYKEPTYRKFDVTNEGTADEDKTERVYYTFDDGTSLALTNRLNKNTASSLTQFRDSSGNVKKYAWINLSKTKVDISARNDFTLNNNEYRTSSQLYDSQANANTNNLILKKFKDSYKLWRASILQAGYSLKPLVSAFQNNYDESGTYLGCTEGRIENDTITVREVDKSDKDIKSIKITTDTITSSEKGNVIWENDLQEYTNDEVDAWFK